MSHQRILRLIFIGRLSPEKNPEIMLKIASKTNLPVLFVGEGKLHKSLKIVAQKEGNEVIFKGFQPNPWDLTRNGDLLIVPSINEGDSLVALEAFMNSQPILLNACDDLLRFGLPARHYCSTIEDYVAQIMRYQNNPSALIVSNQIYKDIIFPRNPALVKMKWLKILATF